MLEWIFKKDDYIKGLEKELAYYKKMYFQREEDLKTIANLDSIDEIRLYLLTNTNVVLYNDKV